MVLTTQHRVDILMDSSGRQDSSHRSILISGMLTAQHGMDILAFSSGWRNSIHQSILIKKGAELAAGNGHLDIFEWKAKLDSPVYPN